ncbi:hypothetical protein AbraIFM66951_001787 [Aspergillus brasiliensis]|uniref:Serine hydrolase domain-containing protein n=1 Tax=Aspergillus brasiliensis TaxID=319629 RepID=A0A9W5Z2P8_9EURO|nr:hypothetical protein AbraCBS73388_003815 [Aspergillus brasiliensis]GKZ49381.1 hypothetical protein AbraIFM66951_001787 [Aspergillus brasiliensis]
MGANAQVLEVQIAAITSSLPEHEFVFAEGLEPCLPDPAVQSLFPGPYLCYYSSPTPTEVHEAFALVREVIDEDGPFDGVIGFSQGAALAASMILQHQKDSLTAMPLFNLAIFLGASLPFDLDSNLAPRSVVAMQHQPNGYPDEAGDEPPHLAAIRSATDSSADRNTHAACHWEDGSIPAARGIAGSTELWQCHLGHP